MAQIVARGSCPNNSTPICPLMLSPTRDEISNTIVPDVLGICNDVIDTTGQIHDAERVFKSPVCSRGINEVGQRKLVDVTEPLKGPRVDDFPFLRIQLDEPVDWVPNFVDSIRHVTEIVLLRLKHFQGALSRGAVQLPIAEAQGIIGAHGF
jgi:hypothetical protein